MGDHYYDPQTGEPRHFVDKKYGKGSRPTTIRDARANNLVPSVTTILKSIAKPQLERWKMLQAATAVLTSPRKPDEGLDAFMNRVLFEDKEQDEEAERAAGLGTAIHAAMEARLNGAQVDEALIPWIEPAFQAVMKLCPVVHETEVVLVGKGYAGKCDLIAEDSNAWQWVIDFKSAKTLPAKGSWWEHRLQTAAYMRCRMDISRHANVYISTVDQGKFVIHDNGDYDAPYRAFMHLLKYWQIVNDYVPDQSQRLITVNNT